MGILKSHEREIPIFVCNKWLILREFVATINEKFGAFHRLSVFIHYFSFVGHEFVLILLWYGRFHGIASVATSISGVVELDARFSSTASMTSFAISFVVRATASICWLS